MITPTFGAIVTEKATLKMGEHQRREMDRWIATLKGQAVVITIKREHATRSNQQNRYWWGVVVPLIAEHLGYTNDEMHEALKYKFLRTEAEAAPTDLPKIRSTTSLNTKEFTDLIENVITWAGSEFGIEIPLPNEVAA